MKNKKRNKLRTQLIAIAAAVVVLYRLFRRLEARYGKAPSKPLKN